MQINEEQTLVIQKLVHGGQGLATLADGRKAFIWNSLPGETVLAKLTKNKKDYAEGLAIKILKPSIERIEPLEPGSYLAASPWQILDFSAENKYKKQIIIETFEREKMNLSDFKFINGEHEFNYRNKMEYSFYGDDNGLHLALHNRGSHQKIIIDGSKLAMPVIDQAAKEIIEWLKSKNIRASQLKSLILRCSQGGEVIAALFVKDQNFIPPVKPPTSLKGIGVYFSNPKSPASIITKIIKELGQLDLSDKLLGKTFYYGVNSFFQVNLPVFELALMQIISRINNVAPVVDMYSGVGSIGLSTNSPELTLVDINVSNIKYSEQNSGDRAKCIQASTEKALEYVKAGANVIFDPPRAGLHKNVITKLIEAKPPKIIYLSCNPITQARDIALLKNTYQFEFFEGYNFFPRTPHIETLAVLKQK